MYHCIIPPIYGDSFLHGTYSQFTNWWEFGDDIIDRERSPPAMQENTSIGVVQPPFGFVWSSNHWWSGRVPTLGRVGRGENSQVQLTSGVTLQPGDFIQAAELFSGAVLVSQKRPAFDLDIFFEFPQSGNICHIMSWYGSDMCLMCCHLGTFLSTVQKLQGIGRMQSQTEQPTFMKHEVLQMWDSLASVW